MSQAEHQRQPEHHAAGGESESRATVAKRRPRRIAYFDCFAGISGDMTLGALIDAGLDIAELRRGLESLGLPGWELRVRRVQRHAITASDVTVIDQGVGGPEQEREAGEQGPSHGHEHPPAEGAGTREHEHDRHGHSQSHGFSYSHSHSHSYQHHGHGHSQSVVMAHSQAHGTAASEGEHGHHHEGEHEHDRHAHSHSHKHPHDEHEHRTPERPNIAGPVHGRHLSEILRLIRESGLPEPVKERASAVFQRLGEAEAKIHDVPVETIHFHEVGAVDSIIDIVGSVLGLYLLGVERIVCSPLPAGHGFVKAAHGLMPIPAPATMELLKGVPTRAVDVEGELVTPTGATLMATLGDEFGWMPAMRVETIGYGAGKKEFPFPNLLRICIGVEEG